VNRIIRLLPRRQVASGRAASRWPNLQIVIVVDVARGAGHVGMTVRQGKSGRAVIECRTQPTVKFVAPLAIAGCERRPGAGMRRIAGVLPILQMAGITGRAQPEKHASGDLLVALVALYCGVSAQKRKSILVIANLLHRDIPALNGVALRTVRTHLTAVDIGVTIGAILPHIGECGFHVALGALHFFVHAPERIFRLVVVEFGDRANRAPTCRRVAIFAGNVQRPVRIPLGVLLSVARQKCRCFDTIRHEGRGGT